MSRLRLKVFPGHQWKLDADSHPEGAGDVRQLSTVGLPLPAINPDGTALQYTYNTGCGGSDDQLCSTQDAVGGAVQFQYTGVALGPLELTRLTSRLGVITSYTYPTHAAPWTTAVVGGEAKRFGSIDPSGRVGELDEGDTSGTWGGWLRVQLNSWDSPGCPQPDAGWTTTCATSFGSR